ncbi:MAG: hypothetical protein WC869_05465 [Phycisphaerae bacterium]|jgi:hypothetical protein
MCGLKRKIQVIIGGMMIGGIAGVSVYTVLASLPAVVVVERHEEAVIQAGIPVADEFVLSNPLHEPVTITDIKSSCSCASVTLSAKEIPPKGLVNATIVIKGARGTNSLAVDAIITGHGCWTTRTTQFMLKTSARAERAIALDGEMPLQLGTHEVGEKVALGTIKVHRGKYPVDFDAVKWGCDDEYIKVRYNAGLQVGEGLVTVTSESPAPIGAIRSILTVTLWKDGRQVASPEYVPIDYTLVGPVIAAPKSILFGPLVPGESEEKTIRIGDRSFEGTSCEVRSILWRGSDCVKVSTVKRGQTVMLTFTGNEVAGIAKGAVIITALYDGKTYTIRVPCLGYSCGQDGMR